MSNDISSQYTKDRNITAGRRGYGAWKQEKENEISPKNYGMFLAKKKEKRR